jgi:hypothetical protein
MAAVFLRATHVFQLKSASAGWVTGVTDVTLMDSMWQTAAKTRPSTLDTCLRVRNSILRSQVLS